MDVTLSEVLFWAADNLAVIKPFAFMVLATVAIVCTYYAVLIYGELD